ncbi:MAG: NAD(P)H-hydrate dehydratase [Sphingomicrobium sp.]
MSEPNPLNQAALRQHPLPPVIDGDKETKGRVLIVAGSRAMPGAALLAATAAMRAGAGKLRIAIGQSIVAEIGTAVPEAMMIGLAEAGDELAGSAVGELAEQGSKVDAVAAGPGLTRGEVSGRIADALLECDARLALDAALLHDLQPFPGRERESMPVLLPHRKELASLLDCREEEIERDPLGCGIRAAELYRSIVLVKGVTSHVVTPNGDSWTYDGGAPGLGISGSGDVLAGIVGGLLARGAEPLNALLWAVWLHGEAGARLAKKVGPIGFLARQIADEIPALLPR